MKTVSVTIPVRTCEVCHQEFVAYMFWEIGGTGWEHQRHTIAGQLKHLGYRTGAKHWRYHNYCAECEEMNRLVFDCVLCKQQWPSSEVQQSFGDPTEYLCKTCYQTVPAATWDKTVDDLEEAHKYDFE